ncbi:RHS repeat-associated core domain-containing protein [Demequina activiva]|uniref:Bacterial EndoU nuclease domain-containing protein n=1 Tax=Demequina activiva TaxID=1582364 RepID=A0A919UKT8_9MICO|nr:RHS repeat-associated core domain-containing protein [Demequina activiva]GIG55601.1 hypothetical protein Dac01nite_23530 [Demequina activiva]
MDAATQTLSWDAASNLTAVDGDTFMYDGAGQRVARITGTTASVWVGDMEVTDTDPSTAATVQARRFFQFEAVTVGYRDGVGVLTLMGDEQGSLQLALASDGTVTRNACIPYGVTRGVDGIDTEHCWLGQVEDDATGLTYLNACYFDPALGRFLSPDTLMSHGDPRTLDPYRYADNNPISYTDPTGLEPACASGGALDQDACFYGTQGVELDASALGGGANSEWDRGGSARKRPSLYLDAAAQTQGDVLFIPKMIVNAAGGALNVGIDTVNLLMLGIPVFALAPLATGSAAPAIPTVGVWGGDEPLGAIYYGASYTGSGLIIVATLGVGAGATGARAATTGTKAGAAAKTADDFVDLASATRRNHILNGDATGGGHLWPGLPGKTPFPKGWSGDRVMHEISDVATDPRSIFRKGRGNSTIVTGTRDGVDIRVILRNGDIVTGFPTNLPMNP